MSRFPAAFVRKSCRGSNLLRKYHAPLQLAQLLDQRDPACLRRHGSRFGVDNTPEATHPSMANPSSRRRVQIILRRPCRAGPGRLPKIPASLMRRRQKRPERLAPAFEFAFAGGTSAGGTEGEEKSRPRQARVSSCRRARRARRCRGLRARLPARPAGR
jgi:hypothetical protein